MRGNPETGLVVPERTLMCTTKAEREGYFNAAVVKEPDRPVGHRKYKELDLPVGHPHDGVDIESATLDDAKDHDRPVGHHQCKERDLPVGHLRGSSFFDDGKGPDRLVDHPDDEEDKERDSLVVRRDRSSKLDEDKDQVPSRRYSDLLADKQSPNVDVDSPFVYGCAKNHTNPVLQQSSKVSRVKDRKRGAAAWANLARVAASAEEAGQRMLIHTVSDATALNCYVPAVRKFLQYVKDENLDDGSNEALDQALLQYMGKCCYIDDNHPHQGSLVINALCYVWPDVAQALPLSWRASKGWTKFGVVSEGQPVAPQRLAVMQDELWQHGSPTACEAGDACLLAVDGYLREQDFLNLQVQDVVFSDGVATLLLGVASRGESAKTGRNQGVVLDEPLSFSRLQSRCAGKQMTDKVFPRLSAPIYSKWWRWAARKACGDPNGAGPPHSARHSGPSRDLTTGYRSLESILKRGRWKALSSVSRYAKPHSYYACLARLGPDERLRGDRILEQRAPRAPIAMT